MDRTLFRFQIGTCNAAGGLTLQLPLEPPGINISAVAIVTVQCINIIPGPMISNCSGYRGSSEHDY